MDPSWSRGDASARFEMTLLQQPSLRSMRELGSRTGSGITVSLKLARSKRLDYGEEGASRNLWFL